MSKKRNPERCYVCGVSDGVVFAQFQQVYPQQNSKNLLLDWWECRSCRGLFVYPVPSPDAINRYFATMDYLDPSAGLRIAKGKERLQRRILAELSSWTTPGKLLDFGCNFGDFLVLAREAGWAPSGFEPHSLAAETARAKGFDVSSKWSLEEAGFAEGSFSAITAIDVFCLVWDPITTLRAFHRLLKPGGVLAMRLTNKRFVLELARVLSRPGSIRDGRVSNILLGQFHSIGVNSFRHILRKLNFDRIKVEPRALVAPWASLGWPTQIAYAGADAIYCLSLGKVNVSPGVLCFCRRSFQPDNRSADGRRDVADPRLQPVAAPCSAEAVAEMSSQSKIR